MAGAPMLKFLSDLFKGVGNAHWDLARISAAWAIFSTSAIAIYKLYVGQDLHLTDYATAMMTVLGGCAVFIASKDVAKAHAEKAAG